MAATWRGNIYLLVSFPVGLATSMFLFTMYLASGSRSRSSGSASRSWRRRSWPSAGWRASSAGARRSRSREPIPRPTCSRTAAGCSAWIHTALGDSATWKDMLWLILVLPVLGLAGFTLAVCSGAAGWGCSSCRRGTGPSARPGVDLGAVNVDTLDEAWIGVPLGLVILTITVPLTRGLGLGLGAAGARAAGPERAPPGRRARAHAGGRRRLPGRRAAADRARPPRRRAGAAGRAGDGPRHGAGEARQRPGRRAGAGRRRARRGQAGARRAARPLARHLPRDPHRPRARAGAVLDRRPQPGRGGAGRRRRRPPARGHRGGRLLRRGRGADQRRQALGRRALPRAHRAPRATGWSSRSPTTATAAPTRPAPG